ncbi:hypothetical protein ZWY2020_059114 [Hordeum vulgare]|nr:hypothetical protein ZWY2020_059114 [Hordeum vulgare]
MAITSEKRGAGGVLRAEPAVSLPKIAPGPAVLLHLQLVPSTIVLPTCSLLGFDELSSRAPPTDPPSACSRLPSGDARLQRWEGSRRGRDKLPHLTSNYTIVSILSES